MKKKIIGIMSLIVVLSLTGCGSKGNPQVAAGMNSIKELDYEGALESFGKAIVESENLELAYRGQGIAYLSMSKYEEAIEAFERALANSDMFVDDVEIDINFYLATAQYKLGNYKESIKILDGIINMRDSEEAFFLRGQIKVTQNQVEEGIKDLERAMELSKGNVERLIQVYQVLDQFGQSELGATYLQATLDNTKRNLTDYEKGRIYYYLGNYEEARNFLETARTSNKEKTFSELDIILMLGQAYMQLGDVNYASTLYDNYISQNSDEANSVELYNRLGLCKLELGDAGAALTAFQKAISIADTSKLKDLKYNEIVAYEYLADFTKAKVLMESYLKAYPSDEKALREYEFLKTR